MLLFSFAAVVDPENKEVYTCHVSDDSITQHGIGFHLNSVTMFVYHLISHVISTLSDIMDSVG